MFRAATVVLGMVSGLVSATTGALMAQDVRPATVRDCVTVQYLIHDSLRPSLQLNPQGDRVAYLVKSPDLSTNNNNVNLYVGMLRAPLPSHVKLVLTSENASSLQWEKDGRHVVLLLSVHGRKEVDEVDTLTAHAAPLLRADEDVVEYSITPDGKTIAFATETSTHDPNVADLPRTAEESMRGYRIEFSSDSSSAFPKRRVFIAHRLRSNHWGKPQQIAIKSQLTGGVVREIPYEGDLDLSLSPDGKKLLFRYVDSSTKRPASWEESPFVQQGLVATGFSGTPILALYDVATSKTSVPLQTPFPNGVAAWAPDSSSFIIKAQSPVSSVWEAADLKAQRLMASKGEHLFWVELSSEKVTRITPPDVQIEELISWNPDEPLVVRTAPDEVSYITQSRDQFKVTHIVTIPASDLSPYSQIAGNEGAIVVDDQNLTTPPRLLLYRTKAKTLEEYADLNPQFTSLRLASTKRVSWALPDGYEAQGILFTPPDYREGVSYPLVISATVYGGGFVCDSGDLHLPAFAPVPMANAGLLYLMRTYPSDWTLTRQQQHYPKGYPGGIGEAAFQSELWDSAVDKLSEEGVVDRNRVGIIGFSRTGWYTEFALVHGRTRYAAASAVDNVKYGLAEYWLSPRRDGVIRGFDAMYGGPPYGPTRSAWEKYSISFNLENIQTPLLMEQMGYGRQYDHSTIIPVPLTSSLEVFSGLKRLGKPVDFFYYPTEEHQPDHPVARLSSLQRNVDWFRFWLQGFEDHSSATRGQYDLWREMRIASESSTESERHR